jgi:C-terminal processing protease CtpA/Prc
MSNQPRATTRRRLLLAAWSAVGVCAILPQDVRAQSAEPDNGRVIRVRTRSGDTLYAQTLRSAKERLQERADSLRREYEELRFDAPDRRDVLQKLNRTLTALRSLSSVDEDGGVRINGSMNEAMQRSQARVLARSQAFAGRIRAAITSLQPGWIGINTEAAHERVVRGDSAYIRYFGYPEVVSVEPNSPAERVGIERGDRILAYDGADVRDREINLTRLLQPAHRITVRVQHDGEEREFPIVVSRPPPQVVERMRLSIPDGVLDSLPGRVLMMQRGTTPSPPMPPTPRAGSGVFTFNFNPMDAASAPVAGATVVEIKDEAFGHIFGVTSGVLVTEVFSDPAQASGLRGGDVILRADGQDVTRVAQLRRIVASHNGSDRSIDLQIIRQKKPRVLTLHW